MAVDPVAAARWFVETIGCTAFPVWGSRGGRCNCGDPHDGTGKHAPENIGKHPATVNGFKDATADLAAIARFLSNPGTPNYGLNAAPGILIVDVDGPGLDVWDQLQHQYGPLPVTLTTTTANGRHYWFRWPEEHGPVPVGKLFGFVVRRHDDGYVLGPGSIHPTGVQYDTLRQPDGHPYGIATLPEAWAKAAIKPTTRSDPGTITVDAGGYQLPEPGYSGARYDEIVRYVASRYIRGLSESEIWAGVVDVLAPRFAVPLTEPELRSRFERAWANTPRRLGPPHAPEVNEETGEVRMVQHPGGVMLDVAEEERFPGPPDEAAFGGMVGEIVAELARGTDAPRIGILASLLPFLGALVPSRGHFGRPQASSLFVGLVGPSGEGRKGTAMARVHDTLAATIGYDVLSRSLLDGVNSGEGLVTGLEFRQRTWKREPPSVILYEEEFATLLAAQNRDGSSLDSRLRAMWDITALSNRRRDGSQSVTPPYWASVLAAITPEELRTKSPEKATTTGSYNRWLWVPVVRRDEEVEDTPPDLPRDLADALRDAHRAAFEEPPYLPMEQEASRLLSAYSRHLSANTVGLELDLSRRLAPIAYRIGMVHAAVERCPKVGADHLARGIAVTEYARSGVRWVFGFTVGDRYASLLLRHLREREVMTQHEITQSVVRDPIKCQAAIDELLRLGFAERRRVATPGRPRYELRIATSRPLFTPFVQSVRIPPSVQGGLNGSHGTHESHETHGMHGMHERGQKVGGMGAWLRPCRDYLNHQDAHRQTPEGWVCDTCEEEA